MCLKSRNIHNHIKTTLTNLLRHLCGLGALNREFNYYVCIDNVGCRNEPHGVLGNMPKSVVYQLID